jgi:hypothetical protein
MDKTDVFDTIRQMDRRGDLGRLAFLNDVPNPEPVSRRGGKSGTRQPNDPKFAFIDLFAGIGGMRYAFEAAGGACVATCEWDKFSRQWPAPQKLVQAE